MHGNGNGKTETTKHYRSYNKLKCIGIGELNFGLERKNKKAPPKMERRKKKKKESKQN